MATFNVYIREKVESCVMVDNARDADHALEIARNGGGDTQWKDSLGFIDEERWHAERLDDDEDEEPEDAPPVAPPDLFERLQAARIARREPRLPRVPVPPPVEDAEEVDFNG